MSTTSSTGDTPIAAERDLEIARRLAEANLRTTSGRRLVLEALARAENPLSVTELHEFLRDRIPLSSLYRIISDLGDARVVRKLEFEEGFARYEFDEDLADHHHHLVCTTCGMVVDVPLPHLEDRLAATTDEIAAATGFVAATHRLDFFGTCRDCADKGRERG
jgi:Fur family transcriptional regulator, ferric uptake regulator